MEMKKLASAIAYDNLMSKQATPAWLVNLWKRMAPTAGKLVRSNWALPVAGGSIGLAAAAPDALRDFREGNTAGALSRLSVGAGVGTGVGFLGRHVGRMHMQNNPLNFAPQHNPIARGGYHSDLGWVDRPQAVTRGNVRVNE